MVHRSTQKLLSHVVSRGSSYSKLLEYYQVHTIPFEKPLHRFLSCKLVFGWLSVGRQSAGIWAQVGQQLVDKWSDVSGQLVVGLSSVSCPSVVSWLSVSHQLVFSWLSGSCKLIFSCSSSGSQLDVK